ncbi:cytochrome c biogenesis protein [Psychroflexus planctonicus]|uniref:Cytochrome c biogenesis protein n=1 Tax=Psychroflexus planctonicus TaxID=1526575 RepID=A0ABQ1SLG5_9FLAO|nr:cytochrome c biogenesis protein CcsA [Psychroflexus planctonicus]GGE42622.1 cytochrome c biogenesis protein [Psychroflexus planctonicus]
MIQQKIKDILFSTRLMAALFVIYAVAMAIGTFVENSYSTTTAKYFIYDAWWFEVIMVFFVINFVGNIFRYKLLSKKKLTTLLLHLSFILILAGAWITRYIGYEGVMPIREGEVANTMLTQETYLSTYIDGEVDDQLLRKKEAFPLILAPKLNNNKRIETDFDETPVHFQIVDYFEGAQEQLVATEDGENYLKMVETGSTGQRQDRYLREGEVANISNMLFAFNKYTEGAVNISGTNSVGLTIQSPFDGEYMHMADQQKGDLVADSIQELQLRSLYNIGGMQVVFPDEVVRGEYSVAEAEKKRDNMPDGVILEVTANGEKKKVGLLGGSGFLEDMKKIEVGGFDIYLRYGSKEYELPFALKLNDFIAEKHPGTEDRANPSYASFMSKVEVVDGSNSYPYDIYMNHVLDHKGYRFFQASFDADEGGTILSVNHDWWGTWVTYIGYFLLYLGLMAILFDPHSRFGVLRKKLDAVKAKKTKLASLVILFFGLQMQAQNVEEKVEQQDLPEQTSQAVNQAPQIDKASLDSIIKAKAVSKSHAKRFGELIIQDADGRMKPVNTYSSELLRKLSKKDEYAGLTSDQAFISMIENPMRWFPAPIIYLKPKNDSLHNLLGIDRGKKYVSITDFFDENNEYKLAPFLRDAYSAAVPNQFQKDFIEADQRVNLLYDALQGNVLRVFPIPNHPGDRWVSIPEIRETEDEVFFVGPDSTIVHKVFPLYMSTLQNAIKTDDYSQPNELLTILDGFQKKHGSKVIPSEKKVKAEILYNEIDIFNALFQAYLYVGLLMVIFVIIQIFKESKFNTIVISISKVAFVVLLLLHTLGLAARWYISGHAPWSDAYESMIYVAWATAAMGLAFGRKSDLTMGATAFVTAIILMVAHWNWMDPSISNLQPVLDSYWLMIHVAVIVGSYGPFALGTIIGIVALILMIFTNKNNFKKMKLNIQELSYINELALTVGLVMLTIGNFLGGQWANESWGRYWGWDPKETWALISIFVYAFVIHMRLVPGMRGFWAFNWASVIAFGSILMTYFGVNFYLTGLHSYASGDQIISYKFIFGSLLVWLILGYFSRKKYKKFYAKPKPKIAK